MKKILFLITFLLLPSCTTIYPDNCWKNDEELYRSWHFYIVKCWDGSIYSVQEHFYFSNSTPLYLTYDTYGEWAEYMWNWLVRIWDTLKNVYKNKLSNFLWLKYDVKSLERIWERQFKDNSSGKYYYYKWLENLFEIEYNGIIQKVNTYLNKDDKYVYNINGPIEYSDSKTLRFENGVYRDDKYVYWDENKEIFDDNKINSIRNKSIDKDKKLVNNIYKESSFQYINKDMKLAHYNGNIILGERIILEGEDKFTEISPNWFFEYSKWVILIYDRGFNTFETAIFQSNDYKLLQDDFLFIKDRNQVIYYNKSLNSYDIINTNEWDEVTTLWWFVAINGKKYDHRNNKFFDK